MSRALILDTVENTIPVNGVPGELRGGPLREVPADPTPLSLFFSPDTREVYSLRSGADAVQPVLRASASELDVAGMFLAPFPAARDHVPQTAVVLTKERLMSTLDMSSGELYYDDRFDYGAGPSGHGPGPQGRPGEVLQLPRFKPAINSVAASPGTGKTFSFAVSVTPDKLIFNDESGQAVAEREYNLLVRIVSIVNRDSEMVASFLKEAEVDLVSTSTFPVVVNVANVAVAGTGFIVAAQARLQSDDYAGPWVTKALANPALASAQALAPVASEITASSFLLVPGSDVGADIWRVYLDENVYEFGSNGRLFTGLSANRTHNLKFYAGQSDEGLLISEESPARGELFTGTARTLSVKTLTLLAAPSAINFTLQALPEAIFVTIPAQADSRDTPFSEFDIAIRVKPDSTTTTFSGVLRRVIISASTYLFEGLSDGTTYEVQVLGRSANTPWSAASVKEASPLQKPGAPSPATLNVESKDGELILSWVNGPDGGSPLTSQLLEHRETRDAEAQWVPILLGKDDLEKTVSGLANGVSYSFRLRQTNAYGTVLSDVVAGTPVPTSVDEDTFHTEFQLISGRNVRADRDSRYLYGFNLAVNLGGPYWESDFGSLTRTSGQFGFEPQALYIVRPPFPTKPDNVPDPVVLFMPASSENTDAEFEHMEIELDGTAYRFNRSDAEYIAPSQSTRQRARWRWPRPDGLDLYTIGTTGTVRFGPAVESSPQDTTFYVRQIGVATVLASWDPIDTGGAPLENLGVEYRHNDGTGWSVWTIVEVTPLTALSKTFTISPAPIPGDRYEFRLVYSNSTGCTSSNSVFLTFRVDGTVPGAPLTLLAYPVGIDVILSASVLSERPITKWQYRVALTESGLAEAQWTDIANSANRTVQHTVSSLKPSTRYFFQVRAFNFCGVGVNSAVASATTGAEIDAFSMKPGVLLTGDNIPSFVLGNQISFDVDPTVMAAIPGVFFTAAASEPARIEGAFWVDTDDDTLYQFENNAWVEPSLVTTLASSAFPSIVLGHQISAPDIKNSDITITPAQLYNGQIGSPVLGHQISFKIG